MNQPVSVRALERKVIDSLYVEAIVLADEARAFFDHLADAHRDALDETGRVDFACESLKVTTRIMHAIAWLLTQRAVHAGELPESARLEERHRLGEAAGTDPVLRARLSAEMEGLILVTEDLYGRIERLERHMIARATLGEAAAVPSPARDLLSRLEAQF